MINRISTFAGLALLASCGSAPAVGNDTQAQVRETTPARPGAAATAKARDERRFDVAGIDLDMAASAAAATLERAGWSVERDPGVSWDEHLAAEIRHQRGGLRDSKNTLGLGSIYARKGDEKLEIVVRPGADGGVIETMRYRAPLAGRPVAQVGPQLIQKYGKPTSGSASADGFNLRWCAPNGCNSGKPDLAAATGGVHGELVITLSWGSDRHTGWDRAVKAAIDVKTGPVRNSF